MRKYGLIFLTAFRENLKNRSLVVGLGILLLLILLTYNQLWIIIGAQEGNSLNTSFIWYLLLGEIIILSPVRLDRTLEDDVKSGTMAYYMNKPISFLLMRFLEAMGSTTVVFFALWIIGGVLCYILTNGAPFEIKHLPILIIMSYLSCAMNVFFKSIVGLCAIWLNNTKYLNMVVDRLAFIFGGAILPLTVYPDWFVKIARFTPFYSINYLTMKLVYDFSWSNLATAFSLNAMWFSIAFIFALFIYGKLGRKVEIYGG